MTMDLTQSEPAIDALSPGLEPAAEPMVEPAAAPMAEPAAAPMMEPAAAPMAEAASGPMMELAAGQMMELAAEAAVEPMVDAAVEPALAPAPAPPKPKPITWETERNAAVAALARVGATPREARVLASLAANAATMLREQGRRKAVDPAVIDDQAAEKVLAAHRAAASPAWGGQ